MAKVSISKMVSLHFFSQKFFYFFIVLESSRKNGETFYLIIDFWRENSNFFTNENHTRFNHNIVKCHYFHFKPLVKDLNLMIQVFRIRDLGE